MSDTKYPQLLAFSLYSSGASIGDTTLVLSTFTSIDGVQLTMANFGDKGFMTLEPGAGTNEEQISFSGVTVNANGTTTLTGVKNVLHLSPYTETSGLSKSHSGGTKAVVAITSGLLNQFANKGNAETVTGSYTFTAKPVVPNVTSLDTDKAANVAYVDSVAIAGAPAATNGTAGIDKIASTVETIAGTNTDGTYTYVIPVALTKTTSAGAGDQGKVPLLNSTGTLSQTFLDAARTWGAVQSFTADNAQITTDANSANDAVRYSQVQSLVGATSAFTTGEAINGSTTPQVVCIKSSDGLLYKSKANDVTLNMAVGFVNTNALITTTPTLVTSGFIGGFTGLTQNATYYVSDTAGTISATQSATCSIPVGRAVSTTTLQIAFGKRTATGTITHGAAAAGTQDVTTTIGFRPTVLTLAVSAAITGSTSTGYTKGMLTYYGTTQVGSSLLSEDDTGAVAITQANVVTAIADLGGGFLGGAWARSGGGNNATIVVTLNAMTATTFTTRIVNTLAAGSGGSSSATITYTASE